MEFYQKKVLSVQLSSVAQSCPTLRSHESQHIRLPCPSSTPGVHSNSCLSSGWCPPANLSSVILFSFCPLSRPAIESFEWVNILHEVAKVLEFHLQHQSFQWTPRTDLLKNGLVGPPCSPRDSQESSPTPQFKASILQRSAFFTAQLSHPYMTTGNSLD